MTFCKVCLNAPGAVAVSICHEHHQLDWPTQSDSANWFPHCSCCHFSYWFVWCNSSLLFVMLCLKLLSWKERIELLIDDPFMIDWHVTWGQSLTLCSWFHTRAPFLSFLTCFSVTDNFFHQMSSHLAHPPIRSSWWSIKSSFNEDSLKQHLIHLHLSSPQLHGFPLQLSCETFLAAC